MHACTCHNRSFPAAADGSHRPCPSIIVIFPGSRQIIQVPGLASEHINSGARKTTTPRPRALQCPRGVSAWGWMDGALRCVHWTAACVGPLRLASLSQKAAENASPTNKSPRNGRYPKLIISQFSHSTAIRVQSFTTLTCGARLNLGPRSQCRSQVNSGCTVLRPQYYYHGSTHISVMMMMMSDATSQPTHRTERNGTKHLIRR